MFNKDFQDNIVEKIFTDTRYFGIFVFIGAIMVGLVAQKCNRDSDYSHILMLHLLQNLEYKKQSIIIQKTLDTGNRNMPYIVFLDKEKLYIEDDFYKIVREGDSISKKESSTLYYIYRNDSTFIYDYLSTSKNMFK
nr:hypothetical protein [uncultured Chryseobacterium sp.]